MPAVFFLAADTVHVRNSARVPVFSVALLFEPVHYIHSCDERKSDKKIEIFFRFLENEENIAEYRDDF